MSSVTQGINHVGLTVEDVTATTAFFVEVLGWSQTGFDPSYPKTSLTDGSCRLTLWATKSGAPSPFDRHGTIGLHHLALEIGSEADLDAVAERIAGRADAAVEFMPELMGDGPRKHMMFNLKGGPRIELTWPG